MCESMPYISAWHPCMRACMRVGVAVVRYEEGPCVWV